MLAPGLELGGTRRHRPVSFVPTGLLFGLLAFATSCDADDVVSAPVLGIDMGDEAPTNVTCEPVLEVGVATVDEALCVLGNSTIAACGGTDGRLRLCDAAWIEHCETVGASVATPVTPAGVPSGVTPDFDEALASFLERTTTCSNTVPFSRPCDVLFKDACAATRGWYVVLSKSGDQGLCTPPAFSCSAEAKCPGGGVSCHVKGDGSCSGADGVGVKCITIDDHGDPQTKSASCEGN